MSSLLPDQLCLISKARSNTIAREPIFGEAGSFSSKLRLHDFLGPNKISQPHLHVLNQCVTRQETISFPAFVHAEQLP